MLDVRVSIKDVKDIIERYIKSLGGELELCYIETKYGVKVWVKGYSGYRAFFETLDDIASWCNNVAWRINELKEKFGNVIISGNKVFIDGLYFSWGDKYYMKLGQLLFRGYCRNELREAKKRGELIRKYGNYEIIKQKREQIKKKINETASRIDKKYLITEFHPMDVLYDGQIELLEYSSEGAGFANCHSARQVIVYEENVKLTLADEQCKTIAPEILMSGSECNYKYKVELIDKSRYGIIVTNGYYYHMDGNGGDKCYIYIVVPKEDYEIYKF